MPKVKGPAEGRITGRTVIDQLIRNMELGQFEMAYSTLLPCIFSLYLHPDDYARLTGVFDLIKEDAKRALSARLEQLNTKPLGLGVIRPGKERQPYKIACKDWAFEFFPDSEGVVPLGDVEIHSELNEVPSPATTEPKLRYSIASPPWDRSQERGDLENARSPKSATRTTRVRRYITWCRTKSASDAVAMTYL